MEEQTDGVSTSISLDLAPQGDVIFLLGRKGRGIRVDSLMFMRASKVFNAMLSGRFREGQKLAAGKVVHIPLPDDDYRGMTIVAAIVQHRLDMVSKTLNMATLTQVVLLADKYDCVALVGNVIRGRRWFPSKNEEPNANFHKNTITMLAAAYVFKDVAKFEENSGHIISTMENSVPDIADVPLAHFLPSKFLGLLFEARLRSIEALMMVAAQAMVEAEDYNGLKNIMLFGCAEKPTWDLTGHLMKLYPTFKGLFRVAEKMSVLTIEGNAKGIKISQELLDFHHDIFEL